jgi:cytochrome c-type biogenesis protein CcmH
LTELTLSTPFLIAICVLAVAAAAPLMLALLGRTPLTEEQREAQRARAALAAARAAGVLSQDEYDAKLATLPAPVAAQAPVAGKLAILIAIVLPLGGLFLYSKFGEPRALDPAMRVVSGTAEGQPAPDMAAALAGLEQRLAATPDDAEGWRLLALGYQNTEQFDKALVAMRKVRDLMPDDIDTQVAYAEALALATPSRRIEGEAADIIEAALQRDPLNQRALWIAGMAGLQQGDSATALKHWRTLEAQLPEGSEMRSTLAEQIRSIDPNAAAAAPAAPIADAPTAATPAAAGAQITVMVSLDPALQDKVAAGDTLFVFARAASGPRMPLAIQRLTAADLPAVVRLDDSMGMTPAMKLSMFPDIVIGARISKSGNATPSSGDLQVLTEAINQSAIKDRVQLTISEVVP